MTRPGRRWSPEHADIPSAALPGTNTVRRSHHPKHAGSRPTFAVPPPPACKRRGSRGTGPSPSGRSGRDRVSSAPWGGSRQR